MTINPATRPLAVVTGASSGIGRELARELAEREFDLLVAAEDDELEEAAGALGRTGVDVQAVRVDLSTADGVDRLAERIRDGQRPVDALVLNAGVGVSGPFVETDLEDHLHLIDLNVTGVVRLAWMVVPQMVARRSGRVLFTSSVASAMPGPYMSTYNASKSFVSSFAQALRVELKSAGITVTALMPGPTDTEFFERAGMEDTKLGQSKKDDPAEVARDGIDAMMAGTDHVVAGSFKNRLQVGAANAMPDKAVAAAHAKMSEPGSGT
jgi:short-subunit dehydrogenase